MIPGIVASPRAVVATSPALWTPLNMAVLPQIYLDAQDSVVTDVSGACSAISNLGAMGSNGDFSQSTADKRPTILAAELNGKRVLRFDGTNDMLQGGTTAQKGLFRNVASAWTYVVIKKRTTDASDLNRLIFSASQGAATSIRFRANLGTATAGEANKPALGTIRLDGAAAASMVRSSAIVGNYLMAMFNVDYSTRAGRIYIDGTLSVENTTLTDAAGATSNTDSQEPLAIGSFPNQTGGFPDIDLAAIIVSNTQPSAGDIEKLFGWAAHKYGLTASLPGGHPYKTTPPYA